MPRLVFGAAGLRAHVVLTQDAACGQHQWEFPASAFVSGYILGDSKLTFTDWEVLPVHGGCALGCGIITGPLNAAQLIQFVVIDAMETGS